MRTPPWSRNSTGATYEPLVRYLCSFENAVIARLKNDYIGCRRFREGCNRLFSDVEKHFRADSCASSVMKGYFQDRSEDEKDRYACADCIRANHFCVRLYRPDGVTDWGLAILPLPPKYYRHIGHNKYHMKSWVIGDRAFVAEKVPRKARDLEKGKERGQAEQERVHLPQVTPRSSHIIDLDPNYIPSDDGDSMSVVAILTDDANDAEEDNDIAQLVEPGEPVVPGGGGGEDYEDDELDLIDPSNGDETDVDSFDEDFAPSDEDEEVDEGPEYDPLDYDLPDFDDI